MFELARLVGTAAYCSGLFVAWAAYVAAIVFIGVFLGLCLAMMPLAAGYERLAQALLLTGFLTGVGVAVHEVAARRPR